MTTCCPDWCLQWLNWTYIYLHGVIGVWGYYCPTYKRTSRTRD
jgi:hypothetical protein